MSMHHSLKVVVNTIASSARVVINAIVTLIATRIALKVLGADDFGLYNLLAGTVMLLSFVNGALMVSSQRYFSIAIGEKNEDKLNRYYNASLSIHVILGMTIVLLLLVIRPLLFDGFLNISDTQVDIGLVVYNIMIFSSAITIMTIPYSAIMNSHEDMVMMAVADIVSYILKLVAAWILLFINENLLLVYSLFMLASVFVKALIEFLWSKSKYIEVKEYFSRLCDFKCMREMLGFVGWNTLGSSAVVVRNQGVAVILNIFFGTIINTAYGIANQVNSLVLSFASTLTTVFSPIIISSKGEGRDDKMRETAVFSSKLSFLLSSMLAIPILVFLNEVLSIWLGNYPDSTFDFCYLIVLSFLILQLYPGLNRAIYASGKIKGYQISITILLVSILPIGCLLFRLGLPPYAIMVTMLVSQIGTLVATIYYGEKHCGFSSMMLYRDIVFKPILLFVLALVFFSLLFSYFSSRYTFNSVLILAGMSCFIELIYVPLFFFYILNQKEKSMIRGLVSRIRR